MIPWKRAWQPTPVFLPEKSHGQRSLAGYGPWGPKESGMTEWLSTAQHSINTLRASLVAQMVKNLPTMQETGVWSLGLEDTMKKGMATHSSILAWRIPWTEEPGRLQSMGSQRVGHDWATNIHINTILLALLTMCFNQPQNIRAGRMFRTVGEY